MIDIEFLESLVRLLDDSSLDNLEIKRGGTRVRLSKSPGGPATVEAQADPAAPNDAAPGSESSAAAQSAPGADGSAAEAPASGLVDITSPMVGTFYRAPSPEAAPYVEVGGNVAVGDVLCVIEAMKLMNELESEAAGRIVELCAENAEPVDYGQVLFRFAPA